jgi:hypothetical protein
MRDKWETQGHLQVTVIGYSLPYGKADWKNEDERMRGNEPKWINIMKDLMIVKDVKSTVTSFRA